MVLFCPVLVRMFHISCNKLRLLQFLNFYLKKKNVWKFSNTTEAALNKIKGAVLNIIMCKKIPRKWRSGTKCDCKTDWLWVRSPLKKMKYLLKFIFLFLCSGVEAKRGVEFCHSTRNASRIRQKVEWRGDTECLNTRFPLPTVLCAG